MPRIIDHDQRRSELLDEAESAFAERGYGALSMRQLASVLGVSTGTLYHYFPTKQAVFEALVDRVVDLDVGSIEELGPVPPELLPEVLVAWIEASEQRFGQQLAVLMDAARQPTGKAEEFQERMFAANARYVRATTAALGLDPGTAEVVVHAASGFMVQRMLDGRRTSLAPLAELVRRLVLPPSAPELDMTLRTDPVSSAPVTSERRSGLRLSYEFWRDPFGSLDDLQRSPELVFSTFMGWDMVLVSTPELAVEVLTGKPEIWHKDRLMKRSGAVFGDGLLLSDGETWKRQRRMLQPGFRHARYAAYAAVMREEAEAALASWSEGQRLDLNSEMARVTLRIAVRTLFGGDLDDAGVAAVGSAFTRISDFLASALANSPVPLPRWLPLPELQRYYAAVEELEAVVQDVVARRREAVDTDSPDLLGMLLAARDEDGSSLDDQEIRDQVMTFLLAGHETTALLLTHALLLLGHHPEERARLEAEVDAIEGDIGMREPLPRTRAAIAETLRLRPPAWVLTREATQDTTLGGLPIPAGTIVCVAPWQLHQDPRYWGETAGRFDPDRFAEGAPAPPHGAYLPFGLGGRKCIGLRFAELEARLVLATWVRAVRVEPESAELPELQPSITARPSGPVWATVRRR